MEFVIVGATNSDLLSGSTGIEIHNSYATGGTVVINVTLCNRDGESIEIHIELLLIINNLDPLDLLVGKEVNFLREMDTAATHRLCNNLLPVRVKCIGISIIIVHVHAEL